MLVNPPKATTTTAATTKQIMVRAVSGTMYTVPVGKTFTGHIVVTMGNGCQVSINGVDLLTMGATTPYFGMSIPITLVGGSVVSCPGSYLNWAMIGIEQ